MAAASLKLASPKPLAPAPSPLLRGRGAAPAQARPILPARRVPPPARVTVQPHAVPTAAFLVLLRAKGETYEEIVGLANAMLSCCVRVDDLDDAVDIVRTGSDGTDTVNTSTGSTILAAAAGAKVAKSATRNAVIHVPSATKPGRCPYLQKRIVGCFRSMSRLFSDPANCEENFNMLHQLKDENIWKIFTSLLDCSSTFEKAWSLREDLLKILGEKHALYDCVGALAMKCSYLLVNKEYAKEILSEASEQKTSGNTKLISACMNLLTVISSFFPSLLSGLEEDIVELLKEDNKVLKEGIAHVLSKAGGNIRE